MANWQEEEDARRAQERLAQKKKLLRWVIGISSGFLCVMLTLTVILSMYTVEEGFIGIVKRFQEARYQVGPGLHFKLPFADSVEELEVRTRRSVEVMPSATSEQMPVNVEASFNWTVDKTAGLNLFKSYGGLEQFEERILDRKFRSIVKQVVPGYSAEMLIKTRVEAITKIQAMLTDQLDIYPIAVGAVQIENISLPAAYLQSIEKKQTAKNLAAAEQHNLAKQALEAQRDVNVKKAAAEGITAVAKAEAGAIELKGKAEAAAIKAKAEALMGNPLIIELTKAQNWNGAWPNTIMSGSDGMIPMLDMRK